MTNIKRQLDVGDYPLRALGLFAAAVLLGTVGLAGCDDSSSTAADVFLPPAEEEKLGERTRADYLEKEDVQLVEDDTIEPYVEQLGQQALAAAGDDVSPAIEYEFDVVHKPDEVNAFAMPGGEIFFYSGLLKQADNQAEVMAVMTHEVAHVTERHIAKRLAAQYGLQTLSNAAFGENPTVVEQLVGNVAGKGAMLTYSRKNEKKADEVGIEYAIEADFDPHGFVSFFETLEAQSGPQPPVWLSSHPLPESRIEAAEEKIGERDFSDATRGEEKHAEIVEAVESYEPPEQPEGDAGLESDGSVRDGGRSDADAGGG